MSRFSRILGIKKAGARGADLGPELPFDQPLEARAAVEAPKLAEPPIPPTEPAPVSTVAAEDAIIPGPLDDRFAQILARIDERATPELLQAARLVSAWRGAGHVCFPLERYPDANPGLASRLLESEVVGRPGVWRPLILDDAGRLYLHRYWQYERCLACEIHRRLDSAPPVVDEAWLESKLDILFEPSAKDQRSAARTALTSYFCVITGGPGTGKTRTIARILALLEQTLADRPLPPQIALATPTGKAAARMTESIRDATKDIAEKLTTPLKPNREAITLHQLLGLTPDSPTPRFDAKRQLPVDAVIVDEASMVDLALMAKLFAAVPSQARIILLGDKDQLASVEAGNVLGDICRNSSDIHARSIVELRESYRFLPGSGISQVSAAINAGRADEAVQLLGQNFPDVARHSLPPLDSLRRALRERVANGFRAALTAENPEDALRNFNQFRLLCAVRKGPYGVVALNRLVEEALAAEHLLTPGDVHYHGRPIMVLRNDYTLRLFNGDIGLLLRDPLAGGALRAFFFGQDGALRRLAPSRLPEHETVWAMTIHKSQGSEFDRVLMILPDRDTRVLTRELVYTGITRAKTAVELWSHESTLRAAIGKPTERVSGLLKSPATV